MRTIPKLQIAIDEIQQVCKKHHIALMGFRDDVGERIVSIGIVDLDGPESAKEFEYFRSHKDVQPNVVWNELDQVLAAVDLIG
jgi:hypothetical protein